MKHFTTVLFDFDGTLMDTNDIIIKSWQHTYRTFEGRERPVDFILSSFGEPLEITVKRIFPNEDTEEVIEVYRSYQVEHYKELIEPFPGMETLIKTLAEKGYRMAIVTSRLRTSTEEGLNKYGLLPCFEYVVTADDTNKHKPDPEPVLVALRKLEVKPQEAIMIGDSSFDIQCAHNAGVKAVLVGWAMAAGAQGDMKELGADYIIEEALDLLTILE